MRYLKDHVYVLGKGQTECRSQKLHVNLFESWATVWKLQLNFQTISDLNYFTGKRFFCHFYKVSQFSWNSSILKQHYGTEKARICSATWKNISCTNSRLPRGPGVTILDTAVSCRPACMWVFPSGDLRVLMKNMRTIICTGEILQCQHKKLTSASPGSILGSCPLSHSYPVMLLRDGVSSS